MLLSLTALQTALEVGAIYSLVALALFISFSILNIADLSTDGCYTLGFAVGATVTLAGHPLLALPAAMAAGACSGFVTAFLQTRLGVESILAGIIVNTGLYTVNLAVMGWSSNLSIYGSDSLFSLAKGLIAADWWNKWHELIVLALILLIVCVLVTAFFRTRLGLSIRATGDNADMVRASSINPTFTNTVGLCVANALTGLSGAVVGQAQKTADINSGTGIVVIGLACLIIGETIVGRGAMFRGAIAVVAGSILYRLVYALVLYTKVVPVDCLKLVTALVVALAIAAPSIRQWWAFQTRKRRALAGRKGEK